MAVAEQHSGGVAGEGASAFLAARRKGDALGAFDIARTATQSSSNTAKHWYWLALALADLGLLDRAEGIWRSHLAHSKHADHLSLHARILKERAQRLQGKARERETRRAAEAYHASYEATGAPYPAINAASLYWLLGERDTAQRLAAACLGDLAGRIEQDDYYRAATRAEALFLLERDAEAMAELASAVSTARRERRFLDLARTRQQLRLLRPDEPFMALHPGRVLAYSGVMRLSETRFSDPAQLRDEVLEYLRNADMTTAYGSLAAGSDIVIGEAVLAHGAELHVLLPTPSESFAAASVAPAGGDWMKRFHALLERASSIHCVSERDSELDAAVLDHTTRCAMGLALIRARTLGTEARLGVVLPEDPDGRAGRHTRQALHTWQSVGGEVEWFAGTPHDVDAPGTTPAEGQRATYALLFCDLVNYSQMSDRQQRLFWEKVMVALAEIVARFDANVVFSNTWGDSIFIALDCPQAAAELALAISSRVAELEGDGELSALRARIALHAGPAARCHDPISGRDNIVGAQVCRAARIEPVTPPGQIYASEEFAAWLVLSDPDQAYAYRYAGRLPTAKNYGTFRMFAVDRQPEA